MPHADRPRLEAGRILPTGIFVAAAALRALFLGFPGLDSDQAIIGLMGVHILDGKFPIFFWGEPYSGTLESFLGALLFFVFGVSRQSLALAPTLVSLGFLWAAWRLAREVFGERAGLITLALLAVPPIYLSWNSVLPRGNYVENLLLGTLCLLLALRLGIADLASARGRRLSLLLGGLGGFAWYMSFQSVSYLVAAAVYLGWRHGPRVVRAAPVALVAFLVGSLPFWVENVTSGFGSLEAIRQYSSALDVVQGLQRTWAQLPIMLGAREIAYTYERVPAPTLPLAAPLAGLVFGAAVVVALVAGAMRRQPGTILLALFSATVFIVVLLGGFSAASTDPRYLIPLYSALPVLCAGGLAMAWRWPVVAGGALALLLASNAFTHGSVVRAEVERFPRYRAEDRQLLDFLRTRGLTHCYAPSYWLSYALTFDAREEVIVATPFWRDQPRAASKFPPYTYRVRRAAQPGYLFWGGAEPFRQTLRAAGVVHETTRIGRFVVLHDFRRPAPGRRLASSGWRAEDEPGRLAFDRDPWSVWQGTQFRVDLGAVQRVNRVVLLLGHSGPHPQGFVVEGSQDGRQWDTLAEVTDVIPGLAWTADKLLLEEPRRVAIAVAPTSIRHVRILPRPADQPWTLAELFVFEPGDDPPPPLVLEGVVLEAAQRWGEALARHAARLLDDPADEHALRRAMITAKELRLEGWTAIYDFLSAQRFDGPPEWGLRFARRFHEVAAYREVAWQRLAQALAETGDAAGAEATRAAMVRHFSPAVPRDIGFGRFDRRVRFLGYTVEPEAIRPGDTVEIRYHWQSLRPLPRDSWVFVQFHDGRATRLAHHHQLLMNVSGPVWRPGEIVRDTYSLRIPEELDAGRYTIRLGVWLPESRRRLRVWDGGWPTTSYVANVGVVEVVEVEGAAE